MTKIGIISDTHGCFDNKLKEFLKDTDQIWHAGDFGNIYIADQIASFKPLIGVYGNIDDYTVRLAYPQFQFFSCEEMKILMTHIGGYTKRYNPELMVKIKILKPGIVVCGHSPILKVMFDKTLNHLHINPGAAGNYGFHPVRTAIRITIDQNTVTDMEVGEWKREAANY